MMVRHKMRRALFVVVGRSGKWCACVSRGSRVVVGGSEGRDRVNRLHINGIMHPSGAFQFLPKLQM